MSRTTFSLAAVLGSAILVAGLSGCSNAGEGALSGGGLGAGAGAILGSLSGHAGTGAAIGAVVGGLGGAVIGDQNQRRVCGLNCIYAALQTMDGAGGQGAMLHYDYAHDPAGGIVSFTNVLFV